MKVYYIAVNVYKHSNLPLGISYIQSQSTTYYFLFSVAQLYMYMSIPIWEVLAYKHV